MSTIKVASIQDLSGNPYKGMEVRGMDLASGQNSVILNNITWSDSYNDTTQTIGNPNTVTNQDLTDPEITALIIGVRTVHNASGTYHGYLSGYLFQSGKNYDDDGMLTDQQLYNQYYTITSTPYIVPWDPSGTQSLQMYVTGAYNSSSSNYFQIRYLGHIRGK